MNEVESHDSPSRVGRVVGTEDATPLTFSVALEPDQYLQLDDVVVCGRVLPGGDEVTIAGVVNQIRARHEGSRFDSDVFLVEDGVLPAQTSEVVRLLAGHGDLVILPGAGHLLEEARDELRELLGQWIPERLGV